MQELLFASAALRLVHQSGRSHRPAADWPVILLPAEGLLPPRTSLLHHRAKKNKNKTSSFFLVFFLSSGGAGVHQRHQPQADVLAVPGLT